MNHPSHCRNILLIPAQIQSRRKRQDEGSIWWKHVSNIEFIRGMRKRTAKRDKNSYYHGRLGMMIWLNPYLGHNVDFAGRFGVNQLHGHGLTSAHGNLLCDWSIFQRAKRDLFSCLQQFTIVIYHADQPICTRTLQFVQCGMNVAAAL